METLLQDLRYALRMLWKNPGFTSVVLLTLALGIGANTAIFSVINAVLLQPLPFRDDSRAMVVWKTMSNGNPNAFSTPSFRDWERETGDFAKYGLISSASFNIGGQTIPERILGAKISYDMLPVMEAQPVLGRIFSADEDRPGSGHVVILSHALWKARFGSNPNILGTPVDFDGTPFTVVGVMGPGFSILSNQELFWVPLQLTSMDAQASARNVHWLFAFMRLAPGVTQAQMQAQFQAIATRAHAQDATSDIGFGATLQPVREFLTDGLRQVLLFLMGSVCFVLLIACSNVANLLLARGSARQREMSIRSALGARRSRMVRQWLTESVVFSVVGGGLGLALALAALKVLLAIHPASIPQVESVRMDGNVLAFTMGLSVVVGIVFGIAPALVASSVNLNDALKEGSRGTSSVFGKHRVVLVIAETALASILLIGAALSLKSLWVTRGVDPGFNPTGVLTFRIAAPQQFGGARLPLFYQQVLEHIQTLPGVQAAVLARNLPMSGTDPSMPISIDGTPPPPSQVPIVTRFRAVGPDYFRGMQTALLRGREFTRNDTAASPRVAIVSQSLAKLYWPNEDPIGKRLKPELTGGQWCTVIGLAADVRHWAADIDIEPTAYYPYTQVPEAFLPILEGTMSLAVRSQTGSDLLPSIRAAVADIDKTVPVYGVKSMEQMVEDSGSLRRFDMWLIGMFALLALLLAGIGIYGVMAFSVAQRTREIGIRIALGAQQHNVLNLIVGQGARLALIGVVVGLVGAFALTRLMVSLLYQVSPTDLMTFSVVPALVLFFILLASYIPARRATRVDPVVALRYE